MKNDSSSGGNDSSLEAEAGSLGGMARNGGTACGMRPRLMTRFDCHPRQLRPGVCVCVCVTRSVIGCESVSLSVGIGISSLDVNDTFEEDSPCGWSAGAIPFANWPIRSSSRPIGSSCWCSARGGSPWPSDDNHDRRDQPQQPTATTTTTTATTSATDLKLIFAFLLVGAEEGVFQGEFLHFGGGGGGGGVGGVGVVAVLQSARQVVLLADEFGQLDAKRAVHGVLLRRQRFVFLALQSARVNQSSLASANDILE